MTWVFGLIAGAALIYALHERERRRALERRIARNDEVWAVLTASVGGVPIARIVQPVSDSGRVVIRRER